MSRQIILGEVNGNHGKCDRMGYGKLEGSGTGWIVKDT